MEHVNVLILRMRRSKHVTAGAAIFSVATPLLNTYNVRTVIIGTALIRRDPLRVMFSLKSNDDETTTDEVYFCRFMLDDLLQCQ